MEIKLKGKPIIIGISGESASGKTFLAEKISETFDNNDLLLLGADKYYKNYSKEVAQAGGIEKLKEQGVINFDHPDAYNFNTLVRDLADFKQGKTVYIPDNSTMYDDGTIIPDAIRTEPKSIILIEGLFVLNPQIRKHLDAAIYLDAPPNRQELWFDRAIRRKYTPLAAQKHFEMANNEAKKHVIPYRKHADLIISGDSSIEERLKLFQELVKH